MTEEIIAIGRRAVACKGWRWMPGMADLWGGRMREGDGIDRLHALPDLTDAATLGCLLALVREAWGDASAYCYRGGGDELTGTWHVTIDQRTHRVSRRGKSEAESLVATLEAAP